MTGIVTPRRQIVQPQGRVQVARRWADSLRGAFLLRDRVTFDPISGLLLSGSGAQSVEPFGTAYALSASSGYIDTGVTDVGGVTLFAEDGKPFSAVVRYRSAASGTVLSRAGATAGARTFQIFNNGVSASPTVIVRGVQNAYNWGYQDGEWHIVTVAWDGSSVSVFGDVDREATTSRGTAPEETTQRILIGARTNGANFPLTSGAVEFAYFFDRALSRDEHLALVDNPYQVFRTERRLYAVEATGGGSIDIAGGSTGTGAASASLTTAITVTGAASGSASASMALASNAAAIAGAASASASAALGLTTSIAVTGAAAGSSAAALELSGASSAAISGAASASASSAMALTTNIRVAGGASGAAVASMLLDGSLPIEITGGAVATAQAFAELTTAILIAGATGGSCAAAMELYEQEFIENVSGRVMRVEDAGRSFRVPREVESSPVRRERTMRVGRAN